LIETDQVAPAEKYENGRNVDDNASEALVVFQGKAAGDNIGWRKGSQFGVGQSVITLVACAAFDVRLARTHIK
jgi:hypothetical protein